MRLFIAVDFDNEVKEKIFSWVLALRGQAQKGRFTKKENLHLTLAFIGETDRTGLQLAMRAMDAALSAPFELVLGSPGRFERRGGDIWWLGVRSGGELLSLAQALAGELRLRGLNIEDRKFTPHITLGRDILLPRGFSPSLMNQEIPDIRQTVNFIRLMRSDRVKGALTYTPVYTAKCE